MTQVNRVACCSARQPRSDASSAAFEAAYGTSPMRGAHAVSDESTATMPAGGHVAEGDARRPG